ncbi:hypothetical protein CU669_16915 [Paramagnetospirillum kuznetsovii]|uniref:Uncharacterized protein n=1 Tax=Paramagnetospirillum kuznetsovii TaxID=2053833 RepID=A0A364NUN1_9PROT|nr:hypothetical protein [Paramagnetospirillum kuznetsovii]RAU20762.1 hypothetical protein CU669_16915 [Paramagnetospirillum kuznetsovii]
MSINLNLKFPLLGREQQIYGAAIQQYMNPRGRGYKSEVNLMVWPEIERSQGAVRFETPGGQIWITNKKLNALFGARFGGEPNAAILLKGLDQAEITSAIDNVMNKIAEAIADDEVPITRVASGSTPKSARYNVDIQESILINSNPEICRRTIRVTLPVSQVRADENGQLWAPKWLFSDRLQHGQRLNVADWPGLPEVRKQIESAIRSVVNEVTAKVA